MPMTKNIVGSFEYVSLPQLGISDVLAKVDTGAYSGALHCSSVVIIERDGQSILRYQPLTGEFVETTNYATKIVRSASGHETRRYTVDTEIEMSGKIYSITIGLADRSDMQYDILIGRRFLREYDLLVDTRINQELDYDRKQELT